MKKQYLLGFLLLLTSTIGMLPNGVYAAGEDIDTDGDGVPNAVDQCPHLLEDYDPQYGNNIDGCPADFVPWYDADYDGIQDHIDNCPTVKETYNSSKTKTVVQIYLQMIQNQSLILMVMVIPDYMDLCPNQPETFNGIDDTDGCPDDALDLRDS